MDPLEKSLNISLTELIDKATFTEVCQSYYNLFDIPIRVFDNSGHLLAETTHKNPICGFMNRFEGGKKSCNYTRLMVKKAAPNPEDGTRFLKCACGLQYSSRPIVYQAEPLGKIVFGPYLPADLSQLPPEASSLDPAMDLQVLREMIGKMRRASQGALDKISTAILSVVDLILFSAHKSHVTNQMHIASIRESFREMTEKNAELSEMNEKMRQFERVKANFLSTISHELRTPLTSIIGYSDMLFEGIAGELGDEQKQFVQTIKTKGDELLKLISSILDFSHVETGRLDVHFTQVDPGQLVTEAVELSREMIDRHSINLLLNVEDNMPICYLDPDKITAAITHILDNAIKFSPPNGMLKVDARIAESKGPDPSDTFTGFVLMASPDMLEISIEDFGIGIAPGDQLSIFTPFEQIDNSSTREHGGAGLGLAVVKHFVEAHGGHVRIASKLGEGSKFTIQLPVNARDSHIP